MELFGFSIKKFLILYETAELSYIPGNGNPKKFLIFQETETPKKSSYIFLKESCSYISGNGNPEKFLLFQETELSYISGKRTFLNFRKRKFLIFRERYIQNPSIFRTRSILRILTYLNPGIFRTRDIFRTLSTSTMECLANIAN